MLNKRYIPSFSLVVLFITIVLSVLYVKWVIGPMSYEKAMVIESMGHQLTKEGKHKEAFKKFIDAAEYADNGVARSRRYRSAGTVVIDNKEKMRLFNLSLRYDKSNLYAINGIKKLIPDMSFSDVDLFDDSVLSAVLSENEVVYFNRYPDGWSKSYDAGVIINVENPSQYVIEYFSVSSSKELMQVILKTNKTDVLINKIQGGKPFGGQPYKSILNLKKGVNKVSININKLFNPKSLGMNDDVRDLGVYFKIIKDNYLLK